MGLLREAAKALAVHYGSLGDAPEPHTGLEKHAVVLAVLAHADSVRTGARA
jgi:hypothetical protein